MRESRGGGGGGGGGGKGRVGGETEKKGVMIWRCHIPIKGTFRRATFSSSTEPLLDFLMHLYFFFCVLLFMIK